MSIPRGPQPETAHRVLMRKAFACLLVAVVGVLALLVVARSLGSPIPVQQADGGSQGSRAPTDRFSANPAAGRVSDSPLRSEAPGTNTGNDETGARALLPEHRSMIARAVKFGVVPDADITLGSPSQWEELHRLWNETSKQVVDASVSRTRIAREVAQRRFAEGRYQAYEVDESTRLPNGGFDGPWNKTSHPDEIVSNTYMYRDGGGQIVHHVRFSPGDVPEIDEATAVLRLYEQLRREAVSQFLQQNKSKNGR